MPVFGNLSNRSFWVSPAGRRSSRLALQMRQRLLRIQDDPTPFVELMLEQRQQRRLGFGISILLRQQRRAVQFEIFGEQSLVLRHRIQKRRVADQFGAKMARAQKARRLAHIDRVFGDDGVLIQQRAMEVRNDPGARVAAHVVLLQIFEQRLAVNQPQRGMPQRHRLIAQHHKVGHLPHQARSARVPRRARTRASRGCVARPGARLRRCCATRFRCDPWIRA